MKKTLLLVLSLLSVSFLTPALTYAQDGINPVEDICNSAPNATVCKDAQKASDDNNPLFGPNGIITTIIGLLSVIAGIAAVIIIIVSGLKFITSGNNPQDANNAREGIIYAVVGLSIAVLAQVIVRLFLSKI